MECFTYCDFFFFFVVVVEVRGSWDRLRHDELRHGERGQPGPLVSDAARRRPFPRRRRGRPQQRRRRRRHGAFQVPTGSQREDHLLVGPFSLSALLCCSICLRLKKICDSVFIIS